MVIDTALVLIKENRPHRGILYYAVFLVMSREKKEDKKKDPALNTGSRYTTRLRAYLNHIILLGFVKQERKNGARGENAGGKH